MIQAKDKTAKAELDSYLHPEETETAKGDTYLTLDTLKLPLLEKPQWMTDCEMAIVGAEPGVVGAQVTRFGIVNCFRPYQCP